MLFNTKVLKSGDYMRKVNIKILIIEVLLLIFLLFNSFVFKIANGYIIGGIVLAAFVLTVVFTGLKPNNFRNETDVLLNIVIYVLAYYFLTYFIGVFVGFVRTGYSLTFKNIIRNTGHILILILTSELLRYQIFHKAEKSKICFIIGFIIFVLLDVSIMLNIYDMSQYTGLTKMICLVIFPSVTKNVFLIYLTLKVGYKNGIYYRLLMELPTYLLPIFPDYGEYISTLLRTVLPILIMVKINNLFNYFGSRKINTSRYNKRKAFVYTGITAVLLVIVTLTSGYFKYEALTIGSSSMSPKIEKGDVVIVRKSSEEEKSKIEKGEILVYNKDGRIIVHRVLKRVDLKGNIKYITKGDNNNSSDGYYVEQEDVVGTVYLNVKFIGIPTVALNELLNK